MYLFKYDFIYFCIVQQKANNTSTYNIWTESWKGYVIVYITSYHSFLII